MNTIENLRQKRAETWDKAKAFLDERRGEDGLINAEDTATYEKMETDVVALGKEIDRLEKVDAMDRELSHPTSAPLTNRPDTLNVNEDKPGIGSRLRRRVLATHAQPYQLRGAQRAAGRV